MSKAWAGGSTRPHRRSRAAVLLANQADPNSRGACTLQLDGCTGVADQAHHTLGKAVTGDDPRYMVAACGNCNRKVGDPMNAPDPPGRSATRW